MSMPPTPSAQFEEVVAFVTARSKYTRPTYVDTDADFDKANQKELNKRDKIYTLLLQEFQKLYAKRQQKKEEKKWLFFHIILWSWGIFNASVIAVLVLAVIKAADLLSFLPVMATSIVSLVTSVIVIPEIVTKYLFNPDEDKEITEMIIEMQKHDLSNREMFKKGKPPDKEQENAPEQQNERDLPV